ncbi:MAG: folate family ECF transporter S component [Tissierellaceae bacterium]|nr:folate family ECF transporter S component [Tissierellaceae bacterium]
MYKKNTGKVKTKYLVMAAFLTAISIVLTRFLSVTLPILGGLPAIRVGFGKIPIVISGLLFGPMLGGITGVAADLIGMLINPMGAYHPGFTISSMLDGFLPGLFAIYFRNNPRLGQHFTFSRVFVVELVLALLNSIILNTLWLSQILGKGYMLLLPARVINAAVNLPIQAFIVFTIIKHVNKMVRD